MSLADVTVLAPSSAPKLSLREGKTRIEIRQATVVRQVSLEGHSAVYLSLFEKEIDERTDEFLSQFSASGWSKRRFLEAAIGLEPTDAVIILNRTGCVYVARGGACNFPLSWFCDQSSLIVSTSLPTENYRRLSISGLLESIAVVSIAYQNEPNLSLRSPLVGWWRFRRGAVSELSGESGLRAEYPIDLANSQEMDLTRDQVTSKIRSAFEKFGHRQRHCEKALVELSGGIDSTLAALAAKAHGTKLHGISVRFPYYEFRFEEDIQRAVAQSLGISRTCIDGTEFFAYAPSDWRPRLDEPATSSIAIKRDLAIALQAANRGTDCVLVGEGGDQVFSEHMMMPVGRSVPLAHDAFSRAAWKQIERTREQFLNAPSFLQRSVLTYLYDARLDVSIKEHFGVVTRSPFCDIDVARCGWYWAKFTKRSKVIEGKRILADAFQGELPDVVLGRKGKVAWDGVCARTYQKNGDAIVDEFDLSSATLEHLGLDVRWLTKRVGELSRLEKSNFGQDDKEIFAAYGVATWFRSWGIHRIGDAEWMS